MKVWQRSGTRLVLAVLCPFLVCTPDATVVQETSPEKRAREPLTTRAERQETLARAAWRLGRYDKALDHFSHALTLSEAADAPLLTGMSLNGIGALYASLGQVDRAADYTARSAAILQELHRRKDLPVPDREKAGEKLAASLNGLGGIHFHRGELGKAREVFIRAGALAQTVNRSLDSQSALAASLSNLGEVYRAQGRREKALECHQLALAVLQPLYLQEAIAGTLDRLGTVYRELGRYNQALECHRRALRIHETLGDPHPIAGTWSRLGDLYQTKRAWREAESAYRRAIDCREMVIPRVADPSQVGLLQLAEGNLYARCAGLLLHQNRPWDALILLERGRAQGLSRQMRLDPAVTREQIIALARRNPDTLYLEWAVVDAEKTLLFALSHSDGLKAFTLPLGESGWQGLTDAWRDTLTQRRPTEETHAAPLSTALLAPLETAGLLAPGRYTRLVVVPDGPLLDIPFAALLSPRGLPSGDPQPPPSLLRNRRF